jgi:Zn-dependent M28 family amino/carboxypeptidase
MQNVEAERRGTTRPDEIILLGAHIDTVYGSAGADDNASGLAVLLELARLLSSFTPGRTIRFVAFGNEENQNSPWEMMGSYRYAKGCHERKEKIVGMISLEMLGVYCDTPGSQQYPLPFSLLYPEVGNFVAFIGNLASRKWVHRCIGKFREQTPFPSEGVAAPDLFKDINRSDQWSFWQFGYPGIMLTDTSNFRNKLYHTAKDTPEILDFERMARLTAGLAEMLKDVVNE